MFSVVVELPHDGVDTNTVPVKTVAARTAETPLFLIIFISVPLLFTPDRRLDGRLPSTMNGSRGPSIKTFPPRVRPAAVSPPASPPGNRNHTRPAPGSRGRCKTKC